MDGELRRHWIRLTRCARHTVLLGFTLVTALSALSALGGSGAAWAAPGESLAAGQAAEAVLPVASDVRIAGDEKQTRFILDLDQKVSLRAFTLADPYRVVIDLPQIAFHLDPGAGTVARGLIKAFRYGMVMPGGSRMVFDLAGPARVRNASALEAANGQPARMVIELEAVDRTTFVQGLSAENRPDLRPAVSAGPAPAPIVTTVVASAGPPAAEDDRPLVVLDPGHGGIDNGTQANGESEKSIVLAFGLALRDRLDKLGKFRVVMTRSDDTFVALDDRVKVARGRAAALFVSIHADALPRGEGDAQGATVYTLSDKASDAEAQRLADLENKADAIAGLNLTEEPTDVADILIDLAQRETKTFSGRFARLAAGEMKTTTRMHKHPLKSAGFRVLKAPDVPSVLIELGYVSNKDDLQSLVSENWRSKTVGAVAKAIDSYFAKRMVSAGTGN